MFNPKKKKIQIKSVEDYLKSEEARIPGQEEKKVSGKDRAAKVKPFIGPAVLIILILALMAGAFSQLSGLRSEVGALQVQKEGDTRALRMQIAALSAKLDRSDKHMEALTDNIARIERELEAEKALRAKAEAAAKRPAITKKAKKPARPKT